jgi:hypothetical protein
MDQTKIDSLLRTKVFEHKENKEADKDNDRYIDHYLEQYRLYLLIFNSIGDRRQKSNEFFLGLNTAIIGILGYLETKNIAAESSAIILAAPFIGVAICFCWYQFIISYKKLNRAKFKVIHSIEKNLPLSLFETEWELLGRGQDPKKYRKLSSNEKNIPIIFIILYILIFIFSLPWDIPSMLLK